jgi:peptidyl-prolyl cis-trans isomerase C
MKDFQMKKILVTVAIFSFFLISCNNDMYKEKLVAPVKRIKETVIAEVNGIPITLSDYKRAAQNLPEDLKRLLKEKEKQTQFVENLVTRELLYQEAKRNNIHKRKNIEKLLEEYKKNVLINELINVKVKNKVNITDKEAYKFYMMNKDDFYTPDLVEFTQYFFKDYTDAVNFLKNYDLSQCFNKCFSKRKGLTSINSLPEKIAFALKNLKEGEYASNIVFTDKGYCVLELNKRVQGYLLPFYKVKDEIKSKLKQAKEKKVLNDYIKELKERSKVEIFWEKLKDNETVRR